MIEILSAVVSQGSVLGHLLFAILFNNSDVNTRGMVDRFTDNIVRSAVLDYRMIWISW